MKRKLEGSSSSKIEGEPPAKKQKIEKKREISIQYFKIYEQEQDRILFLIKNKLNMKLIDFIDDRSLSSPVSLMIDTTTIQMDGWNKQGPPKTYLLNKRDIQCIDYLNERDILDIYINNGDYSETYEYFAQKYNVDENRVDEFYKSKVAKKKKQLKDMNDYDKKKLEKVTYDIFGYPDD